MQWFQSVPWTKIYPPTVDLSADDDIGLPTCDPIGRVRSKSNNCDVPMEVTGDVPNVCEREQYLMRRDENKALVKQISSLKEEVQKMKNQKKQKQENEKERYEMITEKLTGKATECKQLRDENKALVEHITALKEEVQKMKDQKKQKNKKETYKMITKKLTEKATECKQLRARIEQMKQDRKLNDVVHEQYVKSFEKLPAKLEEKTKECQVLKVKNTKLVENMRIKTCVDTSNASLRKECKLLQDINAKLGKQSERQHLEPVPEAWRQAMKKEFYSGELTEKDNPTFIELFDQYDKIYTIAQQGPKGEDGNSAFRVPTTIKHQSQNQFKMVMNSLESLLTKDPTFWKTVFSQSLDTRFSSRGGMVYEQLRRACSYDGQHVEYRHMGHLLATCYEKVVVFISNHEAYTFLPLFWVRKNIHISNEKKFENLVGDTTIFWWAGLGSDNQYVRLFTRYEAPMPPVSTLWLAHVDLGICGDFQRDMVQKWFGVTNNLFKALLKENNVKGYKLNDLI
ncbi:hypothetical protein GIB67_005233 [Kingdonia uniflora]|uniref:Uncharacterized protein n=1 Tax=Kingdonia uniflora TaxID=39325 RepID=A0A7J7NN21_9MAGN|nr:hypothetical protein GIB67_005233 [Kingdonia uniflora]